MTSRRCAWCLSDPMYIAYHDEEWGRPSYDDRYLFKMLCLEGMQAGLSWITILKKREHYDRLFAHFDPSVVSNFDQHKIEWLLRQPEIIRHRKKIESIVINANCYLKIVAHQPFHRYLWNMVGPINHQRPSTLADIPRATPQSYLMAQQLKRDGFRFVGPVTCYAFMQAVGMVNDHVRDCCIVV